VRIKNIPHRLVRTNAGSKYEKICKIMGIRNDNWKDKIKAGVLADRLYKHVNGEIELTATQINAAKILLAKVAPDLRAIELKGDVVHNYVLRAPEQVSNVEAWQQRHSQVTLQ
jgi:hypothetical protein